MATLQQQLDTLNLQYEDSFGPESKIIKEQIISIEREIKKEFDLNDMGQHHVFGGGMWVRTEKGDVFVP